MLRLIDQGETVRAWRSDAYWVDLGRREDYERAVTDFDHMRDRLLPRPSNGNAERAVGMLVNEMPKVIDERKKRSAPRERLALDPPFDSPGSVRRAGQSAGDGPQRADRAADRPLSPRSPAAGDSRPSIGPGMRRAAQAVRTVDLSAAPTDRSGSDRTAADAPSLTPP